MNGDGRLAFADVGGRSAVVSARAHAPLVVRTPRPRGEAAWAYLGTLGGGLVDGDAVTLTVRAGARSTGVVTTQAPSKVYRGPRGARQTCDADVEDGALLALLPEPLTCYAGARYAQSLRVRLAPGASVVAAETLTCGRRAYGERWTFARYASRITVEQEGRALLADALLLDAAHGSIGDRMGRWDALVTAVAFGPRARDVAQTLLAAHGRRTEGAAIAASPLREGGALARIAAANPEAAQRAIRAFAPALFAAR